MARRIALSSDLNAISNVVLANFPTLAAMVPSGGFLPVEHIRRKLNDGNVIMAYDTAGGVVGLKYLLEENAVIIELVGVAALTAANKLALWRLARDRWVTRLPSTTRLHLECMAGDPIDTFLQTRFPALRTVTNIAVPGEPALNLVIYETTLGAL